MEKLTQFQEIATRQLEWQQSGLDRDVESLVSGVERLARNLRDRLEQYRASAALEGPDAGVGIGYGYANVADEAYGTLESRLRDTARLQASAAKWQGMREMFNEMNKTLREDEEDQS